MPKKMVKIKLFFQISSSIAIWKSAMKVKCSNNHASYTPLGTEEGPCSLKMSSFWKLGGCNSWKVDKMWP